MGYSWLIDNPYQRKFLYEWCKFIYYLQPHGSHHDEDGPQPQQASAHRCLECRDNAMQVWPTSATMVHFKLWPGKSRTDHIRMHSSQPGVRPGPPQKNRRSSARLPADLQSELLHLHLLMFLHARNNRSKPLLCTLGSTHGRKGH